MTSGVGDGVQLVGLPNGKGGTNGTNNVNGMVMPQSTARTARGGGGREEVSTRATTAEVGSGRDEDERNVYGTRGLTSRGTSSQGTSTSRSTSTSQATSRSQSTLFPRPLTSQQGKRQPATPDNDLFVGTTQSRGPTPVVVVGGTPRNGRPTTSKWVSRGSEEEIKSLGPSRDLIKLSISRKRREFGGPNKFSDRDAHDGLVECRPFKNPNYDLVMREADVGVQGVPEVASTHTQTTWFRKVNAATQYEAMELDFAQRALAQRAPSFAPFLLRAMDDCLGLALQQNETIDLFRPDFPVQVDEEASLFGGKADNVLREIQSFTDLRHSKDKALGSVGWMPNTKGVVAVACLENASFEERVAQSGKVKSSLVLIWNFVDPIHPQALLEAPSDVTVLRFHPSTSILVAGCANGQILYYDLSTLNGHAGSQPLKDGDPSARLNIPIISCAVASSIEASHRTAVMGIVWLHSTQESNKGRPTSNVTNQPPTKDSLLKATSTIGGVSKAPTSNSQFITIASDGQILLWDIRFKKDIKEMDMLWVPLHRMALTRLDMREELTLTTISLSSVSTKFIAATEDGELVLADRAPLMEGIRVQPWINPWHHGPIRSLERSPFFEDVFLTVGDWKVAVWKEGAGTVPLLTSPHCTAAVTVGRWSPTRPGVFYIGRADGLIDVWDLLDKAHVATMSQQVASCALVSMEFPPADMPSTLKQANQLVVGDEVGTLHLLEVPKNLVRQAPNERGLVDALLKLEQARLDSTVSWSCSQEQKTEIVQ